MRGRRGGGEGKERDYSEYTDAMILKTVQVACNLGEYI